MQINQKKVQERLEGIPDSRRSHMYDASIVLEFLTATFMPTRFFLPDKFEPTPGMPLGSNSMRKVSEGRSISIGDLYNLYLSYREETDYTRQVESRYIFGIIIRNLRFYKNRWEFLVYRKGVAQIWYVGPLVFRTTVPKPAIKKFPPKVHTKVEETLVEADPVATPDEDPVIGVDLANGEDKTVYVHGYKDDEGTLHITKVTEDRFIEVEYELPDEPVVPTQPVPVEDY